MIGTVPRRAAAVAAALALAVAPAATAAASPAHAPKAKLKAACAIAFFQYKNLKGARLCRGPGSDSNLAGNRYDGSSKGLDNSISSVYASALGRTTDGRTCRLTLYRYKNYTGAHTTFSKPTKDLSLADNAVGDNRTSSYRYRCS